MDSNRVSCLAASVILALLSQGCATTTRIGDFTLISTKNVDIGAKYEKVASGVTGEDKKTIIIFPTAIPNMKEAADKALEQGNGELLTDVVIYYKFWYIPYVYGESTYQVKGDVWKKQQK